MKGESRCNKSRHKHDTHITSLSHIPSSLHYTSLMNISIHFFFNIIHHHLVHPLVYKSIYTEVHFSSFLSQQIQKQQTFSARRKGRLAHRALPFSLFPSSSIKAWLAHAMMPKRIFLYANKSLSSRSANARTISCPFAFSPSSLASPFFSSPLLMFLQLLQSWNHYVAER